ncbi:DUF503 domain-containing protein [bacterium]|nr:DUF503 domain-containing protein [bacterium]
MPAAIGMLEVEFLIPLSQSLKDKRRVVKSIKDKLRNKLNVSVAEVDHQEKWGRCHLAVVTISSSRRDAEGRLTVAEQIVDENLEIQVTDRQRTWL